MDTKIGVIGLGYVGMPLVLEFGKIHPVVGYDICKQRVEELQRGYDSTNEANPRELCQTKAKFTSDRNDLQDCTIYIITVPTPVDDANKPDLTPLISASQVVGTVLSEKNIVIYESTVYPGATEEVCVPELEQFSDLTFNQDFFVGYSPERINPGDKEKGVRDIIKVTSGSTPLAALVVDNLYKEIVDAGTHRASSIKVAEAAKVIENTQRDINISLMNELAMIFNELGIDTEEVLKAAGTKWNFLPFRPGLVGGHCIGVDPYYLTHKAQTVGYHPEVILAGRRVNDGMGAYIGSQVIKLMSQRGISAAGSNILILGYTFKENCPDTRNTKVIDIIEELNEFGANVHVYDPWVEGLTSSNIATVATESDLQAGGYDAVVVAVAHNQFRGMGIDGIRELTDGPIFDIKHMFHIQDTDWRL